MMKRARVASVGPQDSFAKNGIAQEPVGAILTDVLDTYTHPNSRYVACMGTLQNASQILSREIDRKDIDPDTDTCPAVFYQVELEPLED